MASPKCWRTVQSGKYRHLEGLRTTVQNEMAPLTEKLDQLLRTNGQPPQQQTPQQSPQRYHTLSIASVSYCTVSNTACTSGVARCDVFQRTSMYQV